VTVNGNMNYEPSHRRPPQQERWPSATPGNAWPAYQQTQAMAVQHGNGYAPAPAAPHTRRDGAPWDGAPWDDAPWTGGPRNDGGWSDGGRASGGWDEGGWDGAATQFAADHGYSRWDDYGGPGPEFTGPAGDPEHDAYPAAESGACSVLVAPDMMGDWWQQPDEDTGRGREEGRDSLVIGAVMGFLPAAVAIGVATLAGGLVRQASPVSVLGAVLLDRLPAGPRAALTAHLGTHSGSALLLGLAAVVAVVAGVAARRNAGFWVAGLGAAGLLGAFVAVTRPGSQTIDVLPPAVGGAAGILALLWLARAAAPLTAARAASARVPSARAASARAPSGRAGYGSRRRPR
jgi:hypothetical protein